jgi:hypothetical protein
MPPSGQAAAFRVSEGMNDNMKRNQSSIGDGYQSGANMAQIEEEGSEIRAARVGNEIRDTLLSANPGALKGRVINGYRIGSVAILLSSRGAIIFVAEDEHETVRKDHPGALAEPIHPTVVENLTLNQLDEPSFNNREQGGGSMMTYLMLRVLSLDWEINDCFEEAGLLSKFGAIDTVAAVFVGCKEFFIVHERVVGIAFTAPPLRGSLLSLAEDPSNGFSVNALAATLIQFLHAIRKIRISSQWPDYIQFSASKSTPPPPPSPILTPSSLRLQRRDGCRHQRRHQRL